MIAPRDRQPKQGYAPDDVKARRLNDACRVLGVCRSHIYKLHAQGKIRFIKIGNRTLVPEAEINRIAAEGA